MRLKPIDPADVAELNAGGFGPVDLHRSPAGDYLARRAPDGRVVYGALIELDADERARLAAGADLQLALDPDLGADGFPTWTLTVGELPE